MKKKPLLEMVNISKFFPGVKALQNVNLKAYGGEVMALLGENGAGKSTLMKVLSGVYKKDQGQIFIEEKEVNISGIKEAESLGVAIIHQELSVIHNLRVYENIFLGNEKINKFFGKLNKSEMKIKSKEMLEKIGYDIDTDIVAGELNVGEMQMIEIVKAISKNSKIIIMDEPTAALTDVETKKLFQVIKRLKSEGIAIIYISHRLDEIFEICDKVTVLRDGKYIGEEKVKNVTKDELISMMVGRKLEEQFPYIEQKLGESVLKVENLCWRDKVKNVFFEARAGEILGIAGLMGSGRTETAKVIFGEYKKDSGNIFIEGEKVSINSPKDAIEKGIAYLSEDRKKEGLVLGMSVKENMTLCNLKKYEKAVKRISKKDECIEVDEYINKLSIKTPNRNQLVKNLSGGNQQKVIIAKWVMISPKILIIDEPTRGIDVGAKKEIYEVLNQLKSMGKSIIIISSDMPEILGISDRIIVMHQGKITGEISRKEATQEKIMKYAVES
ncbi:ribose import ATP-binding protein RbsA [Clostridium acetireducens DSM 10703]|jgi:ribose transport system ATP-binding protein|uniref:Ribose import ATP-binding protein RbsA n=1 Tax=Clostridium acetireducens DSM 10703 TaxID=1121290 RepID=A0A1E8EWI0_9CLOT|nr:sugar ABC transporter ATP-binding protein [Clostridium acetireducens]OFI01506.1 ribose import ATP-binding protein RbsA [Clostridium acetireducens DSM 10703]